MKFVIDTNIIFSALLNSNSNIGELILQGGNYFEYYTINQLKNEILRYKNKIIKYSNISEKHFYERYETLIKNIKFIDLDSINEKDITLAFQLTKDIDENDTMFVALSINLDIKLWTGDKKLITGLKAKGFSQIIETKDMLEMYIARN